MSRSLTIALCVCFCICNEQVSTNIIGRSFVYQIVSTNFFDTFKGIKPFGTVTVEINQP
jgi:hypothetical protein